MNNLKLIAGFLVLIAIKLNVYGSNLTAHAATVDITPPIEMKYTLGGYGERMNRPAESIHDRIFAKAVVFKKSDRKYAVITLDLLGLPSNVKSDLVKRISSAGWKMENILLLPSHSHGSLEMEALNSKNLLNSPQIGIFQPELGCLDCIVRIYGNLSDMFCSGTVHAEKQSNSENLKTYKMIINFQLILRIPLWDPLCSFAFK